MILDYSIGQSNLDKLNRINDIASFDKCLLIGYHILSHLRHTANNTLSICVVDDNSTLTKICDDVADTLTADGDVIYYRDDRNISLLTGQTIIFKTFYDIIQDGLSDDYDGLSKVFIIPTKFHQNHVYKSLMWELIIKMQDGDVRDMVIGIHDSVLDGAT